MTIRRGEPWGTPVERPPDLCVVESDAQLAELVDGGSAVPVGVSGGDLHRALGRPADRREMQQLPIDRLLVTVDDVEYTAVAHVVARRGWWRGRIVAIMNVDHLGDWNVAPRAHPNDGRFDLVDVEPSMSLRERWQARSRLGSGSHLPHPRIAVRAATEFFVRFERPHSIWIDGRRVPDARSLAVEIEPDAFVVLV